VARSLPKAIEDVKRLREDGDLLLAYDRAREYVEIYPDSEELKHAGLLALVRAGATDRAAKVFVEWGLNRSSNTDYLALEARLAKDQALRLSGEARRRGLAEAAARYRRVYEIKPDHYPAINWASLAFLAGEREEARRVAELVVVDPKISDARDYWELATRAEANLLLDRRAEARADILAAAAQPLRRISDRSSTRRQLRLIMREAGLSEEENASVLAPLDPPLTMHVVSAGADYAKLKAVRQASSQIAAALATLRPGSVFASLLDPLEIIFAEVALSLGAQLNVILPMADQVAAEEVVALAGKTWVRRFRACCRKAQRIVRVAEDPSADDTGLGDYAARVAMGLSLLRAHHVDGEAVQIALGGDAHSSVPHAIGIWRETGRRQISIPLGFAEQLSPSRTASSERGCCALVFGDLPGFSKMHEKYLPVFWEHVMGAIGEVLGGSKDSIALKNTWGDAIHLVIPDVRKAAQICLAVQRRLRTVDGTLLGREEPPTLRIGAHYGPVFEGWDPILANRTYYGRALSRAARIEPITPPGTVYVTEAFASILLLESRGEFTCTYVGAVPLAKDFGTFRMYDLEAVADDGPSLQN
jgi:class 3 adenylate cyclase/tetratricopeptide (TPR) repeat protein